MESEIQITFRAVGPSQAISEYVRAKAAKLDAISRVTSCHVVIEAPHKHQRHGRHYRVRVDLTIPGRELVVENPSDDRMAEDVYACIDPTFESAHRLLAEHSRERRHGEGSHGSIRNLGRTGTE